MMQGLYIFITIGLIFLNAFFVAAEFGMVKLRHTRVQAIKERYGVRGRILAEIHQHLDTYISACQVGITLASLALGWVGEPAFAKLLEPVFELLKLHSFEVTEIIAFSTAFMLLSFLHLLVGDLMPKTFAIRQSEFISIWTAVPLYIFYWLMFPIIWILSACVKVLLKFTGLDATHREEHFFSTEEIKLILSSSHLHGTLSKEEIGILEHTLDFSDLKVAEVMRPKKEMVLLNIQEPIGEALASVIKHQFSRYPIYDEVTDQIIGIVHVKDLFSGLLQNGQIQSLLDFLRPVLKVSHQLSALELLRKLRKGMPHFALVYDRRNTLIGFVTLDNLLHVLIGRVKDEFHKTQNDWTVNPDGTLLVKGECSIYSLETALNHNITLSGDEKEVHTLNGLIIARIGKIPEEGDRIEFKEFDAIIEKVQETSILQAKIIPRNLLMSEEKSGTHY